MIMKGTITKPKEKYIPEIGDVFEYFDEGERVGLYMRVLTKKDSDLHWALNLAEGTVAVWNYFVGTYEKYTGPLTAN